MNWHRKAYRLTVDIDLNINVAISINVRSAGIHSAGLGSDRLLNGDCVDYSER